MALTKPTVDSATWGNTNTSSPDMVTPGAGLVNTGFLAYPVKLKRGHLNWLVNKLHQGLRYYMAQGLAAWDASETQYIVGSFVMFGGLGYRLKATPASATDPATDTTHWELLVPVQAGTILKTTRLSASSTFAKTANTKRAIFRMIGGGGGGDGVGPSASSILCGGGGASGSWGEFETTNIPAANWVWVQGAGGAGGVAGGGSNTLNAGSAGGESTLFDGTTTFRCPGGLGAPGISGRGGTPGAIPSGGTNNLLVRGQPGLYGMSIFGATGATAAVGIGGSSPFGAGGGYATIGPGVDAYGWGGGGGGAFDNGGAGSIGGAGLGGFCILIELA